jgi:hypothetical protein
MSDIHDATKYLIKSIETEMFYGSHRDCLKSFLYKLNIKSANRFSGLKFEGLSATLKAVTYDTNHIKLWKDLKSDGD